MKRFSLAAQVVLISLMFGFSGCKNGNLFGRLHESGDSGDVASLSSDANRALRNRDYAAARELFERILAQDPNNAEALYGAAAAAIGGSGLSIGAIVSNVINQMNSSSINGAADLIRQSRASFTASDASAHSILAGVDLDSLDAVIDDAICRLQKIVSGAADNKIAPNDVDTQVNLGALFLIRAALRPIRAGFLDIENVNGEFEVVTGANYGTLCNDDPELVKNVGKDIASSYALFDHVVDQLGLTSNKIITKIRDDIATAGDKIMDPLSPTSLPTACLDALKPELTLSNYKNYDGPFTAPSGC